MPSQANRALPEGSRLENYTIVRTLGAGGFSFVYLAHDENDTKVVIKEYLPSALAVRIDGSAMPKVAATDAQRFRYGMKCFFEEGRALARLQHPNVVRVLNFFRANDTVYLVMRHERGRSLKQHIISRRGEQPDEVWVRSTFAQLLNGLREVHANKLLHLDIKPGNVFLRDDGSPLLIDFGGARQTLSAEGVTLPLTYTPGFAASRRIAAWPAAIARLRKSPGSPRRGCASRSKAAPSSPTASSAATSPCGWPPRPSATAMSMHSEVDQWPMRSWLMRRVPMRVSWTSA